MGRQRIQKCPGVYEIVNNLTGKCYIGSTQHHWWNRVSFHFCMLQRGKHQSRDMQRDFTANPTAFGAHFLCPAKDFAEGKQIEDKLIREYKTKNMSYNGNGATNKREAISLTTRLPKEVWDKLVTQAVSQGCRPSVLVRKFIIASLE